MFDLNRTMFYKAKIDIEAQPGQDALWSLVMSIREWAGYKARRDGYALPFDIAAWSQFKTGSLIKAEGADVRLFSALHVEDDAFTWAAQYREVEKEPGFAPREWITEIGFDGQSMEKGSVSVIVTHSDKPGFIGPLQDQPVATIPRIVNTLLRNPRLRCSVDGFEITKEPMRLDAEHVSQLFELVSNPARNVPIILVSPTIEGALLVDPDTLCRQLGPNALVVFARDCETMNKANEMLDRHRLRCSGGAVRFYDIRPQMENPADCTRHRYITAATIDEKGPEYVYEIARRALAQDVHFWETSTRVDDVKRMNRESSKTREFDLIKIQIQDMALEEVASLLEEQETKADELQYELDLKDAEIKELKRRCYEAESKSLSFEESFSCSQGFENGLTELMRNMSELPRDVPNVARIFALSFPDVIDFSQRGWKSLDACEFEPDVLWNALYDMCTILHPLFAEGCSDIKSEFDSRSRFVYKRGEGKQTHKMSSAMREREDVYRGRDIFIEKHVSSSTGDPSSPRFLRLYFDWDAPSGKLVIGDTKHLTNRTTQKIK